MSCGVTPRNEACGHAEELIEVDGVAGADLEGTVDVEVAVRIAVDKGIDGDFEKVAQAADKPPAARVGTPPILTRMQLVLSQ